MTMKKMAKPTPTKLSAATKRISETRFAAPDGVRVIPKSLKKLRKNE